MTKPSEAETNSDGLNAGQIDAYGDELYEALCDRQTVEPLTDRSPSITVENAYAISLRMLERRISAGERVIGKKIGATSKAVQNLFGVNQPDFGYLTDKMVYASGDEVPISKLLTQPQAEGEIAFVLNKDLQGPGVTTVDVLRATDCILPCFEIVDSRIRDWRVKFEDTVSDNASSGLLVLGNHIADPRKIDLVTVGMVVEKNGAVLSTGAGAAALGSPAYCVAWLANTLGQFDVPLKAGEIILSGSLVPLEPVTAGDFLRLDINGVGTASVRFT